MSVPFHVVLPRDLVRVHGPDAGTFLQALLSQDLDPVDVGESVLALLLQPQGKLLADLRLTRTGPAEWWCDCEADVGEPVAAALERLKIRVKVEIEAETVSMLAVRGDAQPPVVAPPARVLPLLRGGWRGFDVLGPEPLITEVAGVVGVAAGTASDYEAARIEAGVPRQGADIDERTIPQEAFLDRDAVSFTKGCFVGQELVCRIDTRGHVNRLLRRLRADGRVSFSAFAPGAIVLAGAGVRGVDAEGGEDRDEADREVGRVTSASGEVALAMLRREVEPGATVVVAGPAEPRAGSAVEVVARVEAIDAPPPG